MSAHERVLEALAAHGSTGRGASFRCPAHEDRQASLTVRPGEDRVLVYCHAGCTLREIAAALGLSVADLFDGKELPEGWEPPLPPAPWTPPPPLTDYLGERDWNDHRTREQAKADAELFGMADERFTNPGVHVIPEDVYRPTPLERVVVKVHPELDWMLLHPPGDRFWLHGEHYQRYCEKQGEISSWALKVLRQV